MLLRADIHEYVRAILVDDDQDGPVEFHDAVIDLAIHEAVIAIARLRPEMFSERIELAWSASEYAFTLPTSHDRIVHVIGLLRDSRITPLRPLTPVEAANSSRCRSSSNEPITSFIWTRHDPSAVRVDGQPQDGDKMFVVASVMPVVQVTDAEIPIAASFLPDVIDYTFKRLYQIESSSQGQQQYHDQQFRQSMALKLQADDARNPIASMLEVSGS